jgi:hypothetical protein
MFLEAILLFLPSQAFSWNQDYAYGLPKQRRMCVKHETPDTLVFSSVFSDERCPPGSRRYVVVFGREPRGSMGLLAVSTAEKFYPPLTLTWPAQAPEFSGSPLWHFTCVKPHEVLLLESPIDMLSYKGEITFTGKKDCLEAQQRALEYCREEWRGEALLENCPLGWGME